MITVLMDLDKPRIQHKGLYLSFNIGSVSSNAAENNESCWVEPINRVMMLRPLQMHQSWGYKSGEYDGVSWAKPRSSDWVDAAGQSITDGQNPKWKEVTGRSPGDYFVESITDNAGYIYYKYMHGKNQPWFLTWLSYGSVNSTRLALEVLFGIYKLQIFSNGFVRLLEANGGFELTSGHICSGEQNTSGKLMDLLIMPYLGNRILFWSPSGNSGFTYVNNTLSVHKPNVPSAYNRDDNIIVGPSTIAIKPGNVTSATTGRVMIQAGPAFFPTLGEWRTAPIEPANTIKPLAIKSHGAFGYQHDGTTIDVFVQRKTSGGAYENYYPYGSDSRDDIYFKFKLKSSSNDGYYNPEGRCCYTPFVYGGYFDVLPILNTDEPDTINDVTDDVVELSLTDTIEDGTSGKITLRNGQQWIADDGVPLLRLCKIRINGYLRFFGFAENFELIPSPDDETSRLSCSLKSWLNWKKENTIIGMPMSLSGIDVSGTAQYVVENVIGCKSYAIPKRGAIPSPDFMYSVAPTRLGTIRTTVVDSISDFFAKVSAHTGMIWVERGNFRGLLSKLRHTHVVKNEDVDSGSGDSWGVMNVDPELMMGNTPKRKFWYSRETANNPEADKSYDTQNYYIRKMAFKKVAPEATRISAVYPSIQTVNELISQLNLKQKPTEAEVAKLKLRHTMMTVYDSEAENPDYAFDVRKPHNWLGVQKHRVRVSKHPKNDYDAMAMLFGYATRRGVMDAIMLASFQSDFDYKLFPMDAVEIDEWEGLWHIKQMSYTIKKFGEDYIVSDCDYVVEQFMESGLRPIQNE